MPLKEGLPDDHPLKRGGVMILSVPQRSPSPSPTPVSGSGTDAPPAQGSDEADRPVAAPPPPTRDAMAAALPGQTSTDGDDGDEGDDGDDGVTLEEFVATQDDDEDVRIGLLAELPSLLAHAPFRAALVKELGADGEQVVAAIDNDDPLPEEQWDELANEVSGIYDALAENVLTLSWDSETPLGSSGASWIREVAGVYLFTSTDWPAAGPFLSLEDAVSGNDSFSMPTPNAELTGDLLDEELLEIARKVATEDASTWINGVEHVLVRGRLRALAEPE